jgi:glycosyltransferase involved in cell wall biosynthesis
VERVAVDVILPCLDERDALAWVLARIPAGMTPLVVDNGSTDGSAALARQLGAQVVEATARGYGSACDAGLRASRADVVVTMDCDGSLDPAELPDVIQPVLDGELDLVLGHRRLGALAPGYPWPLRLTNRVLAARLSRRTGVPIRDCGPVRAAYRAALLDLAIRDRRSGYPAETVVRAAEAGLRIGQVDVSYRPRIGRSKVTGSPAGFWRAYLDTSAALR